MKHLMMGIRDTGRKASAITNAIIGKVSTIVGKTINLVGFSEYREMKIMLPYGIASGGVEGMLAQVIINDDGTATVIGTYDGDRPTTKNGEVIIYSKFGTKISLCTDGVVKVNNGAKAVARVGDSVTVNVGGVDYTGTITSGSSVLKTD